MPETHDLGKKHYWHYMKQETSAPLFLKSITQEIEPPFRKGLATVVRVPFSQHTFVFGTWVSRLPETEALMAAIQGYEMDYDSRDWE